MEQLFKIDRYLAEGHVPSCLDDALPVERALRIELFSHKYGCFSPFSITMRTPGDDKNLVAGFLLGEGIIKNLSEIEEIILSEDLLRIRLRPIVDIEDTLKSGRNFVISSSCGVCGDRVLKKTTLPQKNKDQKLKIQRSTIFELSKKSLAKQLAFASTGGLHAATLFSASGELIDLKEDVGRHNALDKLIGASLLNGLLPLNQHILLLSGRVSYELVQKAAMAEIVCICALGAPSSLAVETAQSLDVALIGFITEKKFNLYSHSKKVNILL